MDGRGGGRGFGGPGLRGRGGGGNNPRFTTTLSQTLQNKGRLNDILANGTRMMNSDASSTGDSFLQVFLLSSQQAAERDRDRDERMEERRNEREEALAREAFIRNERREEEAERRRQDDLARDERRERLDQERMTMMAALFRK